MNITHGLGSFEAKNLRRMMQFAEVFSDLEIVVPLARQLSWSHFLRLIPLPSQEARLFYAQHASQAAWGKRELTKQIERKAFERSHIADHKLALAAAPDAVHDKAVLKEKLHTALIEIRERLAEQKYIEKS